MDNCVLEVRMFGGFSMSWDGRTLTSGTKSDDTQLARLLQILLHNLDTGVERSKLMQLLDEDSNADDVHHLLRSVLYNARKKLRSAGLPESEYIKYRNGRYYWAEDIAVFEDAGFFEELFERATTETDPDAREGLYRQACYLYKGDFLPQQTRLTWVSREEQRYSQMFRLCVDAYADILRQKGDYAGLDNLGRYASGVSPYNEWETMSIEALVELGRYRDAQDLYKTTIESYQKEMGIKAARSMIDRLDVFSSRLVHRSADPDIIREQLSEEKIGSGAFYCPYPIFQGIYQQMRRSLDRWSDIYSFLMICTLANYNKIEGKYRSSNQGGAHYGLSDRIKDIICSSVRKSDVVCRYARDQFMIILIGQSADGCEIVRDRIDRNFKKSGFNFTIEYDISPVRALED